MPTNLFPRRDVADLKEKCWQFVFRNVNPSETLIGKELQIELLRVNGSPVAAVHPEQSRLSEFCETDE